jgi:hypothetical protein
MQVQINIDDQEILDEILKQELLNIRETCLTDIVRLGADFESLPEYERENFTDALEIFQAAHILLKYVTTDDEFLDLTA